ncbi:hypothetical protein LTR56_024685 [Elasticomyces elasticus]|nr:hypothetical protein LTR56_024685 [Elasticomyces elasticus]KAK4907811.1 hypothetical protein LTR49_023209 [Elasticomyces elasticus]KAK5747974.1 hypothetical protein LTS12_021970 [Elasticomyces elasticus]
MSQKRSRTTAFSSSNNAPPPHAPYALYGTPLTPKSAYVPEWKQEVLDDRGRKRLHGAFTGGFSAGYYNTVGSKEGWTPSTFVSSRDKKQKGGDGGRDGGGGQRVEDYMDEEDLAERESTQTLEVEGGFAGLGGGAVEKNAPGGMFSDLFRPTSEERMGVRLLQRMGWRAGQGIGPKIRRKAQGDDGKGEEHLFAPENVKVMILDRKTDRKGLGFAGEGPLAGRDEDEDDERDARILSQGSRSRGLVNKPGKLTKKSSLGVGVLNDTGSDDEDPYAIGPQIRYNRIIGGDRKKKAGLTTTNATQTVTKPGSLSKKLTQRPIGSVRKCHDGRPALEGFILSLAPLSISDSNPYPPPVVPEGWVSTKQPSSTTIDLNISNFQTTAEAARASTLDPRSRAALLGVEALKGKSVFDFLSPAAREKLVVSSGVTNLPAARGEGAPAGFVPRPGEQNRTLWDLVPDLDKETAVAALHRANTTGWMPYAEDEGKRRRYRYFLQLRAGQQKDLPVRGAGMAVDAWRQELREFAQAAEVFKPISSLMATRFTSSSSAPRLASDVVEGNDKVREEKGKVLEPAEQAAKLGLFGSLTRVRVGWAPTRLLCTRFNVRPPAGVDPGEGAGGEEGRGGGGGGSGARGRELELVGKASLDRMMREANWGGQAKGERGAFVAGGTEGGYVGVGLDGGFVGGGMEGGSGEVGEVKIGEVEVERDQAAVVNAEANEALEGRKAGEAVFRAIFGDSDDEEEE